MSSSLQGFVVKRIWIHGDHNSKMKVWESPFIPSHLTFKKFQNHSISLKQSNNQSKLSIYYNIPKFRILGCYTDILLPPIYTYVPPNYQIRSQKPISPAATFCTREIPSWGLFRRSAGGSIDHGGLLHQHHSLSDDVWVVYLRPSGP